ncbi:MAG TPA: sugar phosphate isomerase/epimerase [Baekduia sp.]|uniref:sugar phosphate isomerase/epimerase family protein n=1 Tax=Baekduia sp. TaxID=2600305 RepID=UPI002D76A8E8|nr:sugar phosphate isomerase/epimerase [Baekduia sp.]HET6507849.1 sugar phosphate isomerase/epimerase [Baekduia sp.]
MTFCVNTDCFGDLPLDAALDVVAELGLDAVEIAAGGHSDAPHLRIGELLADPAARARFAEAIRSRGLTLNAINCSADPLHPRHGAEHRRLIEDSLRLAGELGVDKVVTMSGCPGDAPGAPTINWIWFPWPDDMMAIRERQWEVAVEVWRELADRAEANGVRRIALELLPLQLVYNVPTLLRLRDEIGPVIGANIDPSHMFWQQMDPVRVVQALGPAVHHVHLKDTELYPDELALNGVLDSRPWTDPEHRAWIFRTIGEGHPASFWRAFFAALREAGYDDVLSVENEDLHLPGASGVRAAIDFATPLLEPAWRPVA